MEAADWTLPAEGQEPAMDSQSIDALNDWLVERGLAGDNEVELLHGFANRCVAAGLPLTRGVAIIDTLHPIYEGRVFYWARDRTLETVVSEYGPSGDGESWPIGAESFLPSALRRRFGDAAAARSGRDAGLRGARGTAPRRRDRSISPRCSASPRSVRSARWTAFCRAGRPTRPGGFPMPRSRRCAGWCRCSGSASSRPRWQRVAESLGGDSSRP